MLPSEAFRVLPVRTQGPKDIISTLDGLPTFLQDKQQPVALLKGCHRHHRHEVLHGDDEERSNAECSFCRKVMKIE